MNELDDFMAICRAAASSNVEQRESVARYCAAMIKAHAYVLKEVAESNGDAAILAKSELDVIATMIRVWLNTN